MEKVRPIRNEIERRGHNPLLFFLKRLEDDYARLLGLLREENTDRLGIDKLSV